jgi:hypothetical protein
LAFGVLFPRRIPEGHTVVTATATHLGIPLTSEFSRCITVPEPGRAALLASAAAVLASLRACASAASRRRTG